MKKPLLAALTTVAIVASAVGLAKAQLAVDHRQDPSPVIHGSSDQTIVPVSSPPGVTPTPRQVEGYPIDRLNQLREAKK